MLIYAENVSSTKKIRSSILFFEITVIEAKQATVQSTS